MQNSFLRIDTSKSTINASIRAVLETIVIVKFDF